jgi:hypothetical protein
MGKVAVHDKVTGKFRFKFQSFREQVANLKIDKHRLETFKQVPEVRFRTYTFIFYNIF